VKVNWREGGKENYARPKVLLIVKGAYIFEQIGRRLLEEGRKEVIERGEKK